MPDSFPNMKNTYNVDKWEIVIYNSTLMKKLILGLIALAFVALPGKVLAEGQETICTQSYGGGVVCGVHTPIETGVADNIPLIASGFLGASGVITYLSRKLKKTE